MFGTWRWAATSRARVLPVSGLLALGLLVAGCASDGRRSAPTPAPGHEPWRQPSLAAAEPGFPAARQDAALTDRLETRRHEARFTATESESARQAQRTIAGLFPPQYRATHRAILTVGRKQFVCDGHVTVSTNAGWHLAVVSPLGLVGEVRVRRDGTRELLKVTPLLRAAWSRDFLARDLHWLFVPPAALEPAGRLADGRLVFEKPPGADGLVARYVFSSGGDQWQELELSRKGRHLYRATLGSFRPFEGWPVASPSEFAVTAEVYRLHLRVVEMRPATEVGR